jgi:hypothetical protein
MIMEQKSQRGRKNKKHQQQLDLGFTNKLNNKMDGRSSAWRSGS